MKFFISIIVVSTMYVVGNLIPVNDVYFVGFLLGGLAHIFASEIYK